MINQHKKFMTFLLTCSLLAAVSSTTFASVTGWRFGGSDRYGTSDKIAQDFTSADTVVIASGEDFPNALCATTLAKHYNSPLLLTAKSIISNGTLVEIKRLGATKAIIVADQGTLNSSVDDQLKSVGLTVSRIGGVDRYATSVLVAKQLGSCTQAIVACGTDFPDALSIASIASQLNIPIILSDKNAFSNEATSFLLKDNQITKTYIVGGTGVLSAVIDAGVRYPVRLAGADRYATGLAVLKEFSSSLNFNNIYVATGNNFADALAGAPLAARNSSPIILVGAVLGTDVNAYIISHITANTKVFAFGGSSIVSDAMLNSVETGEIPTLDSINADIARSKKDVVMIQAHFFDSENVVISLAPGDYSMTIPAGMTRMRLAESIKIEGLSARTTIRTGNGGLYTSETIIEGCTFIVQDLYETLNLTVYKIHIAK